MVKPEFGNEQEPATPEALRDLHGTVGRIIEELPEGVGINSNTEPSVFYGWKNGKSVFNSQPVVSYDILGLFATEYAPTAAETLKLGSGDKLEIVYAPPCYEAGGPGEEASPVDSYIGLTVSRPASVVEADVFTIEVDTITQEVKEATHIENVNGALDNLEKDELRATTRQEELHKEIFKMTLRQEDQGSGPITAAECAALQEIMDQADPLRSE